LRIIKPANAKPLPVIAHIPHSSVIIPSNVRPQIILNDKELADELLALTDRYTDELFDCIVKLGGYAFVNNLSRLVIDPERFLSDSMESMAAKGMGAVYKSTSKKLVLREDKVFDNCRPFLISRYFKPYGLELEALTGNLIKEAGRCLIIDCHSYPLNPLPYEDETKAERPELCIGTSGFHTPAFIIDIITAYCNENGLSLGFNMPFKDTYVPLKYYKKSRNVSSVMFEIRRDLYMDESNGSKNNGFELIKTHIEAIIIRLKDAFMKP